MLKAVSYAEVKDNSPCSTIPYQSNDVHSDILYSRDDVSHREHVTQAHEAVSSMVLCLVAAASRQNLPFDADWGSHVIWSVMSLWLAVFREGQHASLQRERLRSAALAVSETSDPVGCC